MLGKVIRLEPRHGGIEPIDEGLGVDVIVVGRGDRVSDVPGDADSLNSRKVGQNGEMEGR